MLANLVLHEKIIICLINRYLLGEGAYSSVYRVKRLIDGKDYALKKVKIMDLSEKENALNEVRILASIRHPNVVQYKETFIEENSGSLWYSSDHLSCL